MCALECYVCCDYAEMSKCSVLKEKVFWLFTVVFIVFLVFVCLFLVPVDLLVCCFRMRSLTYPVFVVFLVLGYIYNVLFLMSFDVFDFCYVLFGFCLNCVCVCVCMCFVLLFKVLCMRCVSYLCVSWI